MLDRFTSMQVFLAVVRHGTFAAAAEELGLSRAMASKHVKSLEDHLSVRLLDRTTRAVRMTEPGREYYERIARLLSELEAVENQLADAAAKVTGTLTVSAPTSFGAFHLAPVVADFMSEHPEVAVRLVLTDRAVDLVDEGVDVAVRVSELDDTSYIARRLAAVRMIVCAAPAYLESRGEPLTPQALAGHNCLIFAETPTRHHADWTFGGGARPRTQRVSGDVVANVGHAVREIALRGRGIVRLPSYIVASDLAAGTLRALLVDFEPPLRPVYALYPHRDHVPGKVRAFIEFVARAFDVARTGEHPADGGVDV